jgi:hypothetical protein
MLGKPEETRRCLANQMGWSPRAIGDAVATEQSCVSPERCRRGGWVLGGPDDTRKIVQDLPKPCRKLSKHKAHNLLTLETQVSKRHMIEGGTESYLETQVSKRHKALPPVTPA